MYLALVSGHKSRLDQALSSIVTMGCFQAVNTFNSINNINLFASVDSNLKISDDVINSLVSLNEIKIDHIYKGRIEEIYDEIQKKKGIIEKSSNLQKDRVLLNNYEEVKSGINLLYEDFSKINDDLLKLKNKMDSLDKAIQVLKFIKNIDLDFSEFTTLNFMDFGIYSVSKENILKLKANYENIPSILVKVLSEKDEAIYLSFTPKDQIKETEKIFKSLNMIKINTMEGLTGRPLDIYNKCLSDYEDLKLDSRKLNNRMDDFLIQNYNSIILYLESLDLIEKASQLRANACVSKESFFICGWVPSYKLPEFEDVFKRSRDFFVTRMSLEDLNKRHFLPPTSLKNKSLFKSFEALVKMYGVPSYDEIDPTVFLAITYTLIFGMMFGDIGQGFIFLVAGLYLFFKLKRTSLGGVVSCLGASSMIFGSIYGSIFGIELHNFYLIKPMEDVNNVLIYSVVFGVILLIISYVLHLINSLKKKDYEAALFSKEGIAGMLLFIGAITLVVTKVLNIEIMPNILWIIFFVFFVLLVLLRNPLWNLISKGRFIFDEKKGDYFVENGFGIYELVMNILSNTLSFIRVGAFALNHVGLFLAVSSIAKMMEKNFGLKSLLVYIIGNTLIIILEGLVVFIQGLRLEYYELFSKYFEGQGKEFTPINLNYVIDENVKKKTIEYIINN